MDSDCPERHSAFPDRTKPFCNGFVRDLYHNRAAVHILIDDEWFKKPRILFEKVCHIQKKWAKAVSMLNSK